MTNLEIQCKVVNKDVILIIVKSTNFMKIEQIKRD